MLYVPIGPNPVKPWGIEDTIEKRGELAMRVQFQPCPCPENQRLNECTTQGCYQGFIRTFQDFKEIVGETVPDEGIYGNKIYPRFYPIKSVSQAILQWDDEFIPLDITKIEDDHFEVSRQLKYWNILNITYRVKVIEDVMGSIEVINPTKKVDLGMFESSSSPQVITSVVETYLNGKKIDYLGNTFNAIIFQENVAGTLNYVVKTYTPFKLAYRDSSMYDAKLEKTQIKLDSGDIEVTVSQSERIAEGDIITLVKMYYNTSQFVPYKPNTQYDYLSFAPIRKVINCFTKVNNQIVELKEGEDFILADYERIYWLKEKPLNGFSIRYSYNPSYRLMKASGGANEMKNTPKNYVGKFVSNYRSL